ncbi:MAG: hypothetical protein HFI10_06605 [Lachnospiraceae bacterium]|nr:hypothetical protein [Lachnospiraceae bacterium]
MMFRQKIVPKLNNLLWMVLPLLVVFFSYFFLLGKDCVIEINDQLDETLFTYVLNGKYLFSGVKSYPEMLGGVPKGGMSVSACIFIPLYRLFPVFQAFMIQYVIVAATAYIGMYLCVKELTGNGVIGFLCGGMFMFLPYQPVYGLSIVGGPLIFYAFLCLYRQKHVIIDGLLILYFGLGANLVLLGYVALGGVALADVLILVRWFRKDRYLPEHGGQMISGRNPAEMRYAAASQWMPKKQEIRTRNKVFLLGSLELLLVYMVVNFSLFSELLMGSGGYVSHREEMVITGNSDFWGCVKDVFLNSAQHAFSFHQKLILPILVVVVFYAFRWRTWRYQTAEKDRFDIGREDSEKVPQCRSMYVWLVLILLINILAALFYGFCQSQIVVDFRNSVHGFFHYFAPQRVYWIFPTTWYVAAGLAAGLIWRDHDFLRIRKREERTEKSASRREIPERWNKWNGVPGISGDIFAGVLILIMLIPTAWNIRQNSIWILNKSQYKNNRNVGLMSWADYFAEDLMQGIEESVFEKTGLRQEEYRVASLGMCPAVALEAGFYCIDGYSNNYSLEYKHEFREIIEEELEKCPAMKGYFDDWGSRCYLFTEESQNYYYLAKDADFQYSKLVLNTVKMKEMGCRYLFSAAEIEKENVERLGMELFGVFETEESYYGVWVYELVSRN